MLGSTAVAEVQQIVGWRNDKATEILAALRYAQTEREGPGMTIPWWLLKEDQAMTALTIGSQTLALPTDYIQDCEDDTANLRYRPAGTNTRTIFLKKMDYVTAEKFYFGDWSSTFDTDGNLISAVSPGVPMAYVLQQNSIRVYPAPDQAYVLTWTYWGSDAQIELASTNLWLTNAPWVLIADAAKKIGSDLTNMDAVNTANAIGQRAEANMFRAAIARVESGRRRGMGSRL